MQKAWPGSSDPNAPGNLLPAPMPQLQPHSHAQDQDAPGGGDGYSFDDDYSDLNLQYEDEQGAFDLDLAVLEVRECSWDMGAAVINAACHLLEHALKQGAGHSRPAVR